MSFFDGKVLDIVYEVVRQLFEGDTVAVDDGSDGIGVGDRSSVTISDEVSFSVFDVLRHDVGTSVAVTVMVSGVGGMAILAARWPRVPNMLTTNEGEFNCSVFGNALSIDTAPLMMSW